MKSHLPYAGGWKPGGAVLAMRGRVVRRNGIDFAILNATIFGMKAILTVDKAGRIILPKRLRDSMHLSAGSKLEAELIGGRLQISPEEEVEPPFKVVDGIMVVLGGGPSPRGTAQTVRDERDAMADRSKRTR